MGVVHLIGVIEKVQFLPQQNGGVIYLSEYRKGYKRKDGVRVEDKVDQWRIIFKQGQSKYVSDHFTTGMTVDVLGDIRPFAVEREQTVDGYTIFLLSLNLFAYPRPSERLEKRAIRESQQSSSGVPDIAAFKEPDF